MFSKNDVRFSIFEKTVNKTCRYFGLFQNANNNYYLSSKNVDLF